MTPIVQRQATPGDSEVAVKNRGTPIGRERRTATRVATGNAVAAATHRLRPGRPPRDDPVGHGDDGIGSRCAQRGPGTDPRCGKNRPLTQVRRVLRVKVGKRFPPGPDSAEAQPRSRPRGSAATFHRRILPSRGRHAPRTHSRPSHGPRSDQPPAPGPVAAGHCVARAIGAFPRVHAPLSHAAPSGTARSPAHTVPPGPARQTRGALPSAPPPLLGCSPVVSDMSERVRGRDAGNATRVRGGDTAMGVGG